VLADTVVQEHPASPLVPRRLPSCATLRGSMDLRTSLLDWFDKHRRELPWRHTKDPYAIWVSEVMLQQTQVATVIPYWRRFLERFPDVQTLAAAALPEVFALWQGLGYYSRARNLHRAAVAIVDQHGGCLPATVVGLRKLPGFGPYTAGAVASIAFGEQAAVVDGNVARVFSRLFEIDGAPGATERERALWARAEALVKGPRPGDLNQAVMELGATVCRAEAPTCPTCPIRRHCKALRSGRVTELPPSRVRAPRQRLRWGVAVWRRGQKVLLARRAPGGLFGGLWELPSVPVPNDGSDEAVTLAIGSALGRHAKVGACVGRVKRTLTHRELTLELFTVTGRGTPAPRADVQQWCWATADEIGALGMSTAMARALALVLPSSSREDLNS
jgi:A/G-specific adenine glycosylase